MYMLPSQQIFDDYMREAANAPKMERVNVQEMSTFVPYMDSELLMHELQKVDSMSDEELYKILGISFRNLFDIDFINKGAHRIQIAKAFTNIRFVGALCNVVNSNELSALQKIACNKLIYDYFTMTSGKNEQIENILYNMGWSVNKEAIASLHGRGIDQKALIYLAVARYSTTDTILAVKRVNVGIIDQPISVMTEQTIVDIYSALFSENLTSLFNGIMFDTWDDKIEMDDEQEEIYGTISLALLDIVNDIPTEMIVQLLMAYAQSKQYVHTNDFARFDIHAISDDYQRILYCISLVEADGIMVPHR